MTSKADELGKLADLHAQGILSDREFEDQKREILRSHGALARPGRHRAASLFGAAGVAIALVIALVLASTTLTTPGKGAGVVQFQNSSSTSAASAVQWAEAQYNAKSTSFGGASWALQCLRFVYDAYQYGANMDLRYDATGVTYDSNTDPEMVWNKADFNPPKNATTDISSVPFGALVFFNASGPGASDPGNYSHVAIMGSNGNMYMTPDTPGQPIVEQSLSQRVTMHYYNTFVGWWLPTSSPSSNHGSSGSTTPGTTASVPGYAETSGGVAHTWSNYTTANGTQGSDVASNETIGVACKVTGFQVADGNTWWYRIASSPWNDNYYVSADAFYNNGQTSGSLSNTPFVDNKVPDCTPTPSPAPSPSPAPTPTTYSETTGGVAHTWTNYSNAGGTEGPSIASNQTVQIACKVTGFQVADGNTWWYRIASSPWNDNYYVSADAFYNNGQTSGSLSNTPFVDSNVPNC